MSWHDNTHPDYDGMAERAEYAWDHYSGIVRDKVISQMVDLEDRPIFEIDDDGNKIIRTVIPAHQSYLHRRAQGETLPAYLERARISKYPKHMATLVGSFVGSVQAASIERTVNPVEDGEAPGDVPGLGLASVEGTPMHRIWRDVDGAGTNWETLISRAAARAIVQQYLYYLVDPAAEGREAQIHLIDPTDVLDYYPERGPLEWVKVREHVRVGSDPKGGASGFENRIILYTPEEHERYRKDEDGEWELLEDESGAWTMGGDPVMFYADEQRRQVRCPVGRVRLPLAYDVGYQMAQDANHLYNLLSDIRFNIRLTMMARLTGGPRREDGSLDMQAVKEAMNSLQRGSNVLLGDWSYATPEQAYKAGYEVYYREVRSFYTEHWNAYNDAAREATATEIRQEDEKGRTAFLRILSATLDEFENDVFFLLMQMYNPEQPETWRQATAERGDDFQPLDMTQRWESFANLSKTLPSEIAAEIVGVDLPQMDTIPPMP